MKADTEVLDSKGAKRNSDISTTMIDGSGREFDVLMRDLGFDSKTMAWIIADAAKVKRLPRGTPLYLEGLAEDAERVGKDKKATYGGLPEADRLKLAGFLYRPAEERQLLDSDKLWILYPEMFGRFARGGPVDLEETVKVDIKGLRRIVRCLIESNSIKGVKTPDDKEVRRVWEMNGWMEYEHLRNDDRQAGLAVGNFGQALETSDGYQKFSRYNRAPAIEYICSDVIALQEKGGEQDLEGVVAQAMLVLPYRRKLYDYDYFNVKTTYGERLHRLQDVLEHARKGHTPDEFVR